MVDELCEKLKEINNSSITAAETSCNIDDCRELSPQDLVSQYYAAFPPLSRKASSDSPSLITLIPKWLGSPKKKLLRKQNRSSSYEEKLHQKIEPEGMKARSVNKQRLNCIGRNKKDVAYCRNMAKTVEKADGSSDWNLYTINNRNKRASNCWPQKNNLQKDSAEMVKEADQTFNNQEEVWIEEDENMSLYEDLLDDIRELLTSPEPREDSVEMMNMANMRDTGIKSFISCGTNITSSIWSTNPSLENVTSENSFNSDLLLGLKFGSISLDNNKNTASTNIWAIPDVNTTAQNETNTFFDSCNKSVFLSNSDYENVNFSSIPWTNTAANMEKWSEVESYESEMQLNIKAKSLLKLNHHKDRSCFTEVTPRSARSTVNIFAKSTRISRKIEPEKDKEDLLTSVRSHFRPINEKVEVSTQRYADGTSFPVQNNLDKVNYKRSESGMMYVDSEQGTSKKYLEYKSAENVWNTSEFVLKFNICQNDKACQTDFDNPTETPLAQNVSLEDQEIFFPGDDDLLKYDKEHCKCKIDGDRPDSMTEELMWKYDDASCEKCSHNLTSWDSGYTTMWNSQIWQKQPMGNNIWTGEICHTCLGRSKCHPLNKQQTQLREDVSNDGEQLLSDLSSLQKYYMEELPSSEVTWDISELLSPKERKRRHSHANGPYEDHPSGHRGSWSFASRLREDCLIKMSTIPTLRSVTL